MQPSTKNPTKSILHRVPAEARREKIIEALCAELENAILLREKTAEELDRLREERQKEVGSLNAEMELLLKRRDEAIAEVERLRHDDGEALAALRAASEAATRERDELRRKMTQAEEAHKKQLQSLRPQKAAPPKPADDEPLRQERDAFKAAADKLLGERIQALKDRDDLAAELASAQQTHAEQVEDLNRQRDEAAAQLETACAEHEKELSAAAQAERESPAEDLQPAGSSAAVEDDQLQASIELATVLRQQLDDATTAREKLSGDLTEERTKLSGQIALLTAERNKILAERDDLLARFDRTAEEQRGLVEELEAERDQATKAKDEIATLLSRAEADHEQRLTKLTEERDALSKNLEEMAEARARHNRELEAATNDREEILKTKESLAAERASIASELEQARTARTQEIEALRRERDDLLAARNAIAAEFATIGEQQKDDLEKVNAHQDHLTKERDRLASELAQFREAHTREIEALTTERNSFMAARNELRDYLDVLVSGHRQELEALRQQHGALLAERTETLALIERDRLSWRRQIGFFTDERDTLARERDEALSELAHERQAQGRQVELRTLECENLVAQRKEILEQLEQLREAQKHQSDAIARERQSLVAERDTLTVKLDQAVKSLGVDRFTLLQKRLDAKTQLEAATGAHRQELEALRKAHNDAVQERDAAILELAPIRESRQRELTSLGILADSKYEASQTGEHGPSGRRRVQDRVIGREVEMKVCRGEEPSEAANAELINEVRRLGRLQHPGIPPIYEVGLDQDGRVFYTVKAVSGMSLRTVLGELEHGKIHTLLHFTLKRLLGVFHKVCDAVAFAHAQGIAHGSLMAEHIILGEFGEVFVTHWNLRRGAETGTTSPPDFDPHGDITALGRLLYEITTLENPPEAAAARQEGVPRRRGPGARDGHRAQSHYWDADTNLQTLIAVARRAFDRRTPNQFRSVREFQTQVDAFKDSFEDPVRLTLRRLLAHWARGHRVFATIAITLLLAAAAAGGVTIARRITVYRAQQAELLQLHQREIERARHPVE